MIEVQDIVVQRGGFRLSATLHVPSGQLCAVIGPSGGGKSSLLEAIAGFLPVESGTIRVGGEAVEYLPPADRPVSLLFQEHNLFPHLTVAQNVGLGVRSSLRLSATERMQVTAALEEVDLAGMEQRLPEALSGGQRQRVALARALLRDKPVLLLDEPFAALGPALREEMLTLVREKVLARGAAVLMVTHQPSEAEDAADLTALCVSGRIDGARASVEVFADPGPALAAYLGATRR